MTLKALFLSLVFLPCCAYSQTGSDAAAPANVTPATTPVPTGTLHTETFTTSILKGQPGNQASFLVYTPVGYDPQQKPGYPVLYLLHGWGDQMDAWTKRGHADLALDQMMTAGSAQPMVLVMPLGYGDMSFLSNGAQVWQDPVQISNNVNLFSQSLLTEIMPQVEANYNVVADRDHRGIAGLSMGGQEAVTIGLTNPDKFGWVAGFSSAIFPVTGEDLTALDSTKENLRLLWMACGTDDSLLTLNRTFEGQLTAEGLPVTVVETPGAHEWPVWRQNFWQVAPLLFQSAPAVVASTQ